MKLLFGFLLLLFVFLLFPNKIFAALYINEFSSGTTSDWVEIYNSGLDSVDLSLYKLKDSTTNEKELTGTLETGGFIALDWSNKLNNDGDIIRLLLKSDEGEIDKVAYGDKGNDAPKPESSQTAGRNPDGSSNWVILSESSKGESNNSSSAVPTASPTPTDSPTPTKTPTPTKAPTPTKTPTPAKTSTPTKSPTPTKKPTSSPAASSKKDSNSDLKRASKIDNSILKESSNAQETPTETPESEVLGANTNKSPFLFIALGLIFMAACGIFAYLKFGEKIFLWKRKSL